MSSHHDKNFADNPLLEKTTRQKIATMLSVREGFLDSAKNWDVPKFPGRDVKVVAPEVMPAKRGLSYREGQARLLHDLAAIELQAVELSLRGIFEYPEADPQFREELLRLSLQETEHLRLCLDAIESLGFAWGDWPVTNVLWQAVSPDDSLLDRLFIVHQYLEGSGLDAGETLRKRLMGVKQGVIHSVIQTIVSEEVEHVNFGCRWYRYFCQFQGLDPDTDFRERLEKLRPQLPKRIEPISMDLRSKAGFSLQEIEVMKNYRNSLVV